MLRHVGNSWLVVDNVHLCGWLTRAIISWLPLSWTLLIICPRSDELYSVTCSSAASRLDMASKLVRRVWSSGTSSSRTVNGQHEDVYTMWCCITIDAINYICRFFHRLAVGSLRDRSIDNFPLNWCRSAGTGCCSNTRPDLHKTTGEKNDSHSQLRQLTNRLLRYLTRIEGQWIRERSCKYWVWRKCRRFCSFCCTQLHWHNTIIRFVICWLRRAKIRNGWLRPCKHPWVCLTVWVHPGQHACFFSVVVWYLTTVL